MLKSIVLIWQRCFVTPTTTLLHYYNRTTLSQKRHNIS